VKIEHPPNICIGSGTFELRHGTTKINNNKYNGGETVARLDKKQQIEHLLQVGQLQD